MNTSTTGPILISEIDDLVDALRDPGRERPIVIVSAQRGPRRYGLSPRRLAADLAGHATVCQLSDVDVSWPLRDMYPAFATYNGAVRVIGVDDHTQVIRTDTDDSDGCTRRIRNAVQTCIHHARATTDNHTDTEATIAYLRARLHQSELEITSLRTALDRHRSRPITPTVSIQTDNEQPLPRLFVDGETQFRYEIGETWLRHLPESERQQWPLRPFQLGNQFLSSLATDLAPQPRILAVAVDVLTRRAYELPARSVHIYGDGSSDAPAITRRDGATAYRATIRHCPGGPRLLWWERVDGTAELAWVGHHDDPMPT